MAKHNIRNGIGRQISLLLWKNVLLRRRHWFVTLCEIILPTLIAMLIAFLRTQVTDSNQTISNTTTIFSSQSEEEMTQETKRKLFRKPCYLAYVPHNNVTELIMEDLLATINPRKKQQILLKPFATGSELEAFNEEAELVTGKNIRRVPVAIVFQRPFTSIASLDDLPKGKLEYVIRLNSYTINTRNVFPWQQFAGHSDDNAYSYFSSGFTGLQIMIDKLFMKYATGSIPSTEIQTQIFPYPPFVRRKGFDQINSLLVPLLMIIGFVFIVPSIIIKVVSERETGIKELMKIMGLPNWMHWLGWMMNSLLVLVFSVIIVTFFFFHTFSDETGPVMPYSDPTVWATIFIFYVIAATAYCFFISVLMDNAAAATALGIISWLVCYLVVVIPLEQNAEGLSLSDKLASCLFPNVALHWAIKAIYSWETRGVGANWGNLFQATSPIDGFALYHVFLMFIVDTILFLMLTIYFENVLPTKYGLRKPWNYIFMWNNESLSKEGNVSLENLTGAEEVENDPSAMTVGVDVQKLQKNFGNKSAVCGISFKMYQGQVTALVGHNGAGKTTTLSILTGLFPPSSGTAIVNGHDIRTHMDKVRESLGLCPQHNMLFDKLTVWEHLVLFGRMKGLGSNEAQKEAKILIHKLQLIEKTDYMSCDLSGGQKRKLSLGIALIGGSKIVVLDECTSGMDPEARRVIWDLLLEMRGDRTIILTTHFMEEADILGDRIIMMNSGRIKCSGTPLFLKKFYGAGYSLKITTDNNQVTEEDILGIVKSFIPSAFTNNVPSDYNENDKTMTKFSELSISVPSDDETLKIFPSLFKQLQDEKSSLGIVTMSLSLSTIDQVFLKIGESESEGNEDESDLDNDNTVGQTMAATFSGGDNKAFSLENPKHQKRRNHQRIFRQQIYGLLQKKIRYTIKNKRILFAQFIMPIFLLALAIVLGTKAYSPAVSSPPILMNISQFKTAITYYSADDKDIGDIFSELVGPSAHPTYFNPNKTNMINELLKVADDNLGAYRDQYAVAATLNSSIANAMYNSIPYHSSPIAVNLVTNSLLKNTSPKGKDYSIELTYHPLENNLFNILQAAQPSPTFTTIVPIVFGTFVPIGFALFAASFIIFPTEERLSNSIQLQLMTGVSPITFWMVCFLWDFLLMAVAIFGMGLCFPIMEFLLGTPGAMSGFGGFGAFLVIMFTYGYSVMSFSYLVSPMAPSASSGFSIVTILHILLGLIAPLFIFFVDNFRLTDNIFVIILRWTFRLITSFGGSTCVMRFAAIATSNSRCSLLSQKEFDVICDPNKYTVDPKLLQCCPNCDTFINPINPNETACFVPENFFSMEYKILNAADAKWYPIPSLAEELIYIAVMAIVYNLIMILSELGMFQNLRKHLSINNYVNNNKTPTMESSEESHLQIDEDVLEESQRIEKMNKEKNEDAFVVSNLSKNYGRFAAVRNLNFGVHHGECFGLLGVNGAGKSTTFRMLTGDEIVTSGNAFSSLSSMSSDRKDFLSRIGYCPQFDAIIESLSGKEMLQLFAHLRGVPFKEVDQEVNKWLHKLGLEKSGDNPCGSYSGGMKRRLSIGIAMIGDPPVVLLDEPTSGVDPVSRRQFWKVISSAKASGQSVILTSHSMDEIEILCSRLAIMVNGRFQCIGNVEYLRNKFAQGYTLIIRLLHHHTQNSPLIANLKSEIFSRYSHCQLQDEHQNVLQFQLIDPSISWEMIFRHMEDIKEIRIPSQEIEDEDGCKVKTYRDLIEDYTVSQTSLEEVFLSFARKQYNEDRNDQFVLFPCC